MSGTSSIFFCGLGDDAAESSAGLLAPPLLTPLLLLGSEVVLGVVTKMYPQNIARATPSSTTQVSVPVVELVDFGFFEGWVPDFGAEEGAGMTAAHY